MEVTKITVKWQAADGYVGGQRPQVTIIEASDFVGRSREEAEEIFDEIMEDAFRQKVCWECDDYEGVLKEIMDAAAKLGEGGE